MVSWVCQWRGQNPLLLTLLYWWGIQIVAQEKLTTSGVWFPPGPGPPLLQPMVPQFSTSFFGRIGALTSYHRLSLLVALEPLPVPCTEAVLKGWGWGTFLSSGPGGSQLAGAAESRKDRCGRGLPLPLARWPWASHFQPVKIHSTVFVQSTQAPAMATT
jgi:hypothetical protein